MLDHPEKTPKLLAALKAAVPFEVELTERLANQLRAQHHAGADQFAISARMPCISVSRRSIWRARKSRSMSAIG
jgi:hypothetical protein